MTIVYVVFKEAIARHECGGVFTSLDKAVAAATDLLHGERDQHHYYTVVPFDLDAQTEQTPIVIGPTGWRSGGELVEAEPLATLKPSRQT